MQQRIVPCEGGSLIYDPAYFAEPPAALFDAHYLSVQGLLHSFGSGRGTVWLFRHNDTEYALRHYRRGGKAALLWEDRYLWTGRARTRPQREARLMTDLLQQGVPVATPVAWRIQRSALMYRADLISTRIIRAVSLQQLLGQRRIPEEGWLELGALLRRLHDLQVWHADLNLGNILWRESDGFHLIDFDRSRRRFGQYWKRRNLNRLLRSCRKESRKSDQFFFEEEDFSALLRGYAGNTL